MQQPTGGPSDITSVGSSLANTPKTKTDAEQAAEADAAVLNLARERFATVISAESQLRQDQLEDRRMMAGKQWAEKERSERIRDKRPALTVNRLPAFKRQITGNARQNRPEIQINPVDDYSDPEVADVLSGIVKHIEQASFAQAAYDTAVEDQATIGRGYFKIVTEYCDYGDQFSMDLDIRIKRVPDAHAVYYDPSALEVDYADALFAFIATDYATQEFKRKFNLTDDDLTSLCDDEHWAGHADYKPHWVLGDSTYRACDYYYVEFEPVDIVLLSTGQIMALAEAQKLIAEAQQAGQRMVAEWQLTVAPGTPPPPELLQASTSNVPEIVKTRKAQKRSVKFLVLCGSKVLQRGTWPGSWIPIIPVIGEELRLEGKVDYRGIVRDTRDEQRAYNYQMSALVEVIGLAPKAPYIIASGQLEGYEKIWQTANKKAWAFLPYKAISVNGTFAPPPQRQSFEPAIAAIVQALQLHDNNMKAITGFYDASLGERGPEQSGKAILARQQQGQIGSIHYTDNLGRALWSAGRQILELIPKIYDAPRVLKITGNDDKQRSVMVHAGREADIPKGPNGEQALPPGVKKVYDLSVGRYDVVVGSGPSTATRRQEAVEMMSQAIQAHPALLEVIGDIYFESMDWSKARQIGQRLKKMLPPNIGDDDDQMSPEQLQAQLGQLQQQLQERTAMLQEAQEHIRTDKVKALHQKEIALLNARVELIKLQLQHAEAQRKQTVDVHAAFAKQDRDLGDKRDARQSEFADRREVRQVEGQRHASEQQLHQADTILEAELSNLDTERQIAVDERVREEQRDDQREQRAFEAQQAQQQQAQGQQQGGGAA